MAKRHHIHSFEEVSASFFDPTSIHQQEIHQMFMIALLVSNILTLITIFLLAPIF